MSKSIYCVGKIKGSEKNMIIAKNNTAQAKISIKISIEVDMICDIIKIVDLIRTGLF
jgi:hypothetical protein